MGRLREDLSRLREKTQRHRRVMAAVGVVALVAVACHPAITGTPSGPYTFESDDSPAYTLGNINGQNGWSKTGGFDAEVDNVSAAGTPASTFGFDGQALRMSDAVTGGGFGDQTFTPENANEAGETTAEGLHAGSPDRHGFFSASWSFATAGNPVATAQTGLHTVVSPDRGDGARMSWVEMQDCSSTIPPDPDPLDPGGYECDQGTDGMQVNFYEYDKDDPNPDPGSHGFLFHHVASGLSRSVAHTISLRMWFFEGPDNDVVQVCVDGTTTCVVGNSWEDFFRDVEGNPTRTVDSLLFREGGTANPANAGNGFFIDNVTLGAFNYTGAEASVNGTASIIEGDSGTTNANYTVTLSEPLPFITTVPYSVGGGTATSGTDYTATSGTVTFVPGDTSETFPVPVKGDTTDESHETYLVTLGPPAAHDGNGVAGAESFPRYVERHVPLKQTQILDDDSTLRINDKSQLEGNSGTATMPFTVTLDNPSALTVTVHVQSHNGSAVAPGDYTGISVNLTFLPGEVSKTTTNPQIKGDVAVEPNESLIVDLTSPTNAVLGDGIGAGIILNDD